MLFTLALAVELATYLELPMQSVLVLPWLRRYADSGKP